MKLVVAQLLLILLALANSQFVCEDQKNIKLGVISDLTGSSDYTHALESLDLAAQRLQSKGITQAISLGDMVESLSGMMVQQFNNVTSILTGRGIKFVSIAVGDHDVIAEYKQNSQNRTNEITYRGLISNYGMPVNDKMYYYVEVEDFVIIHLYSFETLGTDPRWGNTFWSRVQEDQLSWLNGVLFKYKKSPVIVITHQPLWYQVSNWYDVHQILRTYGNVIRVIAGHFHYTQSNGQYDGIPYTVVGATGGNTKQGNSNAGDVRLYGVLTLTSQGSKYSSEIDLYSLDTPNDDLLVIPPAKAMDRLQQQAVINGDLVYGGYIKIPNALFYNSTNGVVSTACNNVTAVTFSMIAANAHNIDTVFDLQLLPSNIFTLSNSNFVAGQWKQVLNSTAAVIGGAKNCDLSCTSVSDVVSYYEPIVEMWRGLPSVVAANWTGTTVMTFRFSTSFEYESLTYYLYNDINRVVTACQ